MFKSVTRSRYIKLVIAGLILTGDAAHLAIALLKQATILKTTLLNTYKSMQTYEEILTMVQKLNLDDRFRLLEDLRLLIYEPVMVIGTDEVIPAEVIAESARLYKIIKPDEILD